MHPQSDQIIWLFDSILFGLKQTLEHIGQVTYVELIMEVLSSLSELSLDFLLKLQSTFYDWDNLLKDSSFEAAEMLVQVCRVDY